MSVDNRRHHLSEFRDLFRALFNISDRDVQTRVLDAINGVVNEDQDYCSRCQYRRNRTFSDAEVQTNFTATVTIKKCSISVQTDPVAASPDSTVEPVTPPALVAIGSRKPLNIRIAERKNSAETKDFPSSSVKRLMAQCAGNKKNRVECVVWETTTVGQSPPLEATDCQRNDPVMKNGSEQRRKTTRRRNTDSPHNSKMHQVLDSDVDRSNSPIVLSRSVSNSPKLLPVILSNIPIDRSGPMPNSSIALPGPLLKTKTFDETRPYQSVVKRRKRTSKVPRVEKAETGDKSSIEEILNSKMTPTSAKRSKLTYESEFRKFIKPNQEKNSQIIEELIGCYTTDEINQTVKSLEEPVNVIEQMKREWAISLVCFDGYYAVHKAIVENELPALKRQIYVLKFRKININQMLTDDDETPLQLAVKHNSALPIVSELIQSGADVNEKDKDNNTILHLAMKYSSDSKLLKLLLSKVNSKIFNVYNDNGETALHVGVSEEKFLMCKTFLEFIDQQEKLLSPGQGISDLVKLSDTFRQILNILPSREPTELNARKQSILNAKNQKSGRTPLFLALSNRSEKAEIMVLLLLVHLADPRICDFNGMDSVAFAMETYESNRYNDALETSVVFFEKISLQIRENDSASDG
ncbi:unnamed protein product [Hermetia illucens]|uniref:Uncharacterized protein n=1 Tax=Hermetia illucens TaxID=343691 RepID=A0A7R8YVS9_HERIL|nr:uncharacterized protein LOC119652918 isoform X1 [Hermetia illucens]CAD7086101.1 unnamed protein product [Hermetia illucens]